MKYLIIAAIFLLITVASCKKENTLQDELAKLPPATQTGANTFGCLINGKAWIAENIGCKLFCRYSSFYLYQNSNFGGSINITAHKIYSDQTFEQTIEIVLDSLNFFRSRTISISNQNTRAGYIDYTLQGNCRIFNRNYDSTVNYTGVVNITYFDVTKGIITGTFEFTLTKPGCETLAITNGRFDKKSY